MGNHQHAAAVAVAQAGNQAVQLGLAGDVDALHRFVEYQQFRFAQQRPGQQYTLHLTAGNALDRAVDDLFGADFLQCRQRRRAVNAGYQAQKTQDRKRQGGIDLKLLRHVADAQPWLAPDLAGMRLEQAQHGAHQGGFAGTIGADQGDDLSGLHGQVDAVEYRLAGEAHAHLFEANQRIAHQALRQLPHRPTTSTVCASTLKPTSLALATMASLMLLCSSSMATWHSRQIRNCPWCACSG
ncbi:hypothetical protein D9M71_305050 [compost metagenome]